MPRRTRFQIFKDFVTFFFRAFVLLEHDRWGLCSLRSERFDYVAREVIGYCLDVGCGEHNLFINTWLGGNGQGIDVFPYQGLTREQIVEDMTHFPFLDATFDSVTLIANINHIPRFQRDAELAEAYRVLVPGGNIIVTMGNPVAEIAVHQLVWLYDKWFKVSGMDAQRTMHEEEEYYLGDVEIRERLLRAGFCDISKKYFFSQWWLNHLFVGWKK